MLMFLFRSSRTVVELMVFVTTCLEGPFSKTFHI